MAGCYHVSMGGRVVKRAFKYRFYPTDEQAAELSRTFGCVRKVYNLALEARTEAWTRAGAGQLRRSPRPC